MHLEARKLIVAHDVAFLAIHDDQLQETNWIENVNDLIDHRYRQNEIDALDAFLQSSSRAAISDKGLSSL
jgi:transposase-like protein